MARYFKNILPIIAILICAGVYFARPKVREQSVSASAFNTICTIRVWSKKDCSKEFAALLSLLQELHDCLNIYDAQSELSRLNASAATQDFQCSPLLWECLERSRKAYEITDGAFDITVGPLMQLWGFHGKRQTLPTDQEIADALAKVGLHKVVFNDEERTVRFTKGGMRLDLGGIVKGHACGMIAKALLSSEIDTFLLDFGGNICVSQKPPPGRDAFSIGIRDPNAPDSLIATKRLKGVTIATSGNYERSRVIDGQRVGHIMDPKSGRPGHFFKSVTAITPEGYLADALSTAIFIGGQPLAEKVKTQISETSFLIVE